MKLKSLTINSTQIVDTDFKINWTRVGNAPVVNITDNNHSHNDRYYTLAEVDSREDSLTTSINSLIEKVDLLNESTGIVFPNNTSYISVPSANTSFTNAFTISVGVKVQRKLSDPTQVDGGIIYNKEDSYELAIFPDGEIQFALQQSGGTPQWQWVPTGIIIKPNEKHKVTSVFDGSKFQVYLDGGLEYDSVLDGSNGAPIPTSLDQVSANLMFGQRGALVQSFTNGFMDTIKIYNSALSTEQVLEILEESENSIKNTTGLVAYYNFEGADPLNDVNGKVNATEHGTLKYIIG